jgi:GTP-dependent phosphoenolpyruvate carboxykinase
MPIPKPQGNETEEKYIGRCISEISSEYDAEGQAYAVCKGEFDRDKMSKIKDTTSKVMARVAYDTKFRGINLKDAGDPCWEGYEQYGTKDMDGREVPNCVPISEPK